MQFLIENSDLKRLFSGAAVAVAAGLMLGGAVQPSLDEQGIHAPQQDMGHSGPRTYAMGIEQGVTAYRGQLPDYVIGTDWVRPQEPGPSDAELVAYDQRADAAAIAPDVVAYAEPAVAVTPGSSTDAEPRGAPLYPSERGNTAYDSDLPPPPEPPSPDDVEPAAG